MEVAWRGVALCAVLIGTGFWWLTTVHLVRSVRAKDAGAVWMMAVLLLCITLGLWHSPFIRCC